MEAVEAERQPDGLVMARQLALARFGVVEERAAPGRPRHAGQNEFQILEPPECGAVDQSVDFGRIACTSSASSAAAAVAAVDWTGFGLIQRHAQGDVLRPECPVRVVLLIAGVFRHAVGSARPDRQVVVRIGQAVPRQPDGQFQPGQVQQTTIVVFGRRPDVNIQFACCRNKNKQMINILEIKKTKDGGRPLKMKLALVQSITKSVQVNSISSVVL